MANGLLDPRLDGKRLIAETRLVRAELRIERAIKAALSVHKAHALSALASQHITAAAPPDPFNIASWDSSVDDEVDPEVDDVIDGLAEATFRFLALPPETRAQILGKLDLSARKAAFADQVRSIGDDISGRLIDELGVGIGKGESIDELTSRIDDVFNIGERIAERIARTETHGVAEATSLDSAGAISDAGYGVTKTWVTAGDDRVRAWHVPADGQEVDIDEPFDVNDEDLMYPGDPDGSAENTINCRCSQTFSLGDTPAVSNDSEDQ